MTKILCGFSVCILILGFSYPQTLAKLDPEINFRYRALIDTARSFLKKEDSTALSYYLKAFAEEVPQNPAHIIEAASLSAKLKYEDQAFFLLNLAIEKKFSNPDYLTMNDYFSSLNPEKFEKCLRKIQEKDSLITQISLELEFVFNNDQEIRLFLQDQLKNGLDIDSKEGQLILDSMKLVDNQNLATVNKIIEEYGFLGSISMKTYKSKTTMFLVYQHASTEEKEKKIDIFKQALKNGELPLFHYAYIVDRILSDKYDVQKFGTQYSEENGVIKLVPLIDSSKVDEYRKAYDLDPLEEYLKVLNSQIN